MEGGRFETMKAVFLEALELPAGERRAFVRTRCAADAELLRAVLDLLDARDDAAFLEAPDLSDALATPRCGVLAGGPPLPDAGAILGGRYRLGRLLGEGGWGRVHESLDLVLEEPVAAKLLPLGTPEDARRARREVAALRLLGIPGIVRMRDEGEDGGCAWIVMDLAEGAPFPSLERRSTWSLLEPAALSLLAVLESCHRTGVVHGDLKPANVYVDERGQCTLLDLGMAGLRAAAGALLEGGGTPRWLAPERFGGGPPTVRADLYSVGVMLHEALSGRPAHPGRSLAELAAARLGAEPESLSSLVPGCPAHVVELVARLLRADPRRRPASAASVLRALGGASADGARLRALPALQGEAPLDPGALRELFHGPERLAHLPGDAARLLVERTAGSRRGAVKEIERWLWRGCARWEGEKLCVTREALDLLAARESFVQPREELSREQWRRAHEGAAQALPAGAPGRLAHVAASGRHELLAEEVLASARRLEREGRPALAVGVLLDGLAAFDVARHRDAALAAVRLLAVSAISAAARPTLIRALHEIEVASLRDPRVAPIRDLARAALVVLDGDWKRGQELAERLGPLDTTELELCRCSVRLTAERRGSREREAALLDEIRPWVEACGERDALAARASWIGWLQYGAGRYEDAVAHFATVAALTPGTARAVAAQVARASSLLEAGRHEEAEVAADEARRAAAELRHVALEGRAEWVLRSALYRSDRARDVDSELVEAAERCGLSDTLASIALNEAAVAWRLGRDEQARALAARAERAWRSLGRAEPATLAWALSLACGGGDDAAAAARRLDELPSSAPPGLAVQALALAARTRPGLREPLLERARDAARRVPEEKWTRRREVASIVECLDVFKRGD